MSEALARFQTNEGKTYQIYPEIANEKVYFTNRFGITIVGDIFYPSTFSADKKYPAHCSQSSSWRSQGAVRRSLCSGNGYQRLCNAGDRSLL